MYCCLVAENMILNLLKSGHMDLVFYGTNPATFDFDETTDMGG